MKKTVLLIVVSALALMTTAYAAALPSYYPEGGFSRTARVDAVYGSERRVVIGDMSYQVSDSVVVHSLSRQNDSLTRIRPGAHVAFKMSGGEIVEFWLLPGNYKPKSAESFEFHQ